MTTPKQMEPNVNNALGNLLKAMMPTCKVLSEHTQIFPEHPGRHADVLVTAIGRSPVTVEAEFEPAPEAEKDARERLGLKVEGEPRTIEASVAVRYPATLEKAYDLSSALADATLFYCVLYEDETRFPESGWLQGSVSDLADLVRLVSVPQKEVEQAADILENGIDAGAKVLDKMAELRPALSAEIAQLLGMIDVPQTRRMACAILANALIFHERIAGMHPGVLTLLKLSDTDAVKLQDAFLEAWTHILTIDYYPIFAIAKDILSNLQAEDAPEILKGLLTTARQVNATGVDNAHDLTGRIFQRLIADRKYLATFYTRPASAALLARLAVAKLEEVDWGDAEALGKLRIGDFACGTGALLSAVYEQIAARHERAGGDVAKLHPVMMEEVLYGCDVMPSAIHITGSTLSGMQPEVDFNRSRLYTMPYGRQADGTVKIGSLELLQDSQVLTLFNTSDAALRTGSLGEETAVQVNVDIPDEGFDLVIMNPPFTSNTKHYDAGEGVLNAAFAAFDSSDKEQSDMADRLKLMATNTTYHGHAGLGSAFASLANKKLRSNGIIALVLPFTLINGSSWAKLRELIAIDYEDVTIVSIAANGMGMSFSSDTGIAECLIIARKKEDYKETKKRAVFASLTGRPSGFIGAMQIVQSVNASNSIRTVEDGPFGGNPLQIGETFTGELLDCPLNEHQKGWGAARLLDASVAQVAHSLSGGHLWLPAQIQPLDLPVATLSEVGQRGLDSQLFISTAHKGPFIKENQSSTATFPALWNHEESEETRIVCRPDSSLRIRTGMEEKAISLWKTASRAHISRGFRFNSQSLAVAFTDRETIGGRAWPSITFDDNRRDYSFALWGNSTSGMVSYWRHANLQVAGRGDMTVRSAETLPVLDFRCLNEDQLAKAEGIFEEFRDKELMPAYLADADPNRALLDRRVICDLLGFDESVYQGVRRLAAKWCAEPSVHGGKPRPKDANFVM